MVLLNLTVLILNPSKSLEAWEQFLGQCILYHIITLSSPQKYGKNQYNLCPDPPHQCSSVTQLCPNLCNPMDSTPGFLVHHHLLELAQTHVHWVGDSILPSHSLSSPSPPAFNLSQHQGLFQWVSYLHQVAKVLELQLQHQSFQWTFIEWFPLGLSGLISLQSKGLSGVLSNTTVQKHQFFAVQLCL